jgi:FkbM family methyltransferase
MTPLNWLKELRFRLFYKLITQSNTKLVTIGDVCPWTIFPDALGPKSNVLCAGAGNDISFELELIRIHGCDVVLVDPSPTGIATVERDEGGESRLHFSAVGLSDFDGLLSFSAPSNAEEGSFRAIGTSAVGAVQFPCKTLMSIMSERGWQGIDLLKMDIEGTEYGVLHQMLRQRLDVSQICVEFHHGPDFGRNRMETVRAILALRRAGYDLIYRVQWDHTFLRRAF